MKKYKFFALIILIISFTGCNDDILNLKPLDEFSDATFWNDPGMAESAINRLYRFLDPDDSMQDWECFTDNAISGALWTPSHNLNQKGWTAGDANRLTRYWSLDVANFHGNNATSTTYSSWKTNYREIRAANVAISNLEKVVNRSIRLNQLLAEAKFMRAYFYHNLIKRYGAVIIVDKPIGLNDSINFSRNTYKDCVDFIIKDLDAVIPVLPAVWDATNKGRVTSGAALALKGRVQLYSERWADAATTYQTIISSNKYSLFSDYQTMFFEENENNSEVILDFQLKFPEVIYFGNSQTLSGTQNGWGAGGPSQTLVDQYELLDGKAWSDPTSIYYNAADPYANRDKRFYATVQYDQGVYFGKRLETGTGLDGKGKLIKGADIEKSSDVTQTGYYLCKAVDTRGILKYGTTSGVPTTATGTNVILIRYAEVLLSYAEAQNEAVGADASVYSAVNLVRKRAGLPDLPAGLSQEDMRKRIRKERRVELCFEYMYYYDCLRWRDRSNFATKPKVTTIKYTYALNTDGSVKIDATNRKVINARTLTYGDYFESRTFNLDTNFGWFLPIPQEEIDKNPNIIQNGVFTGNNKQ